jgi:hypothetical protein
MDFLSLRGGRVKEPFREFESFRLLHAWRGGDRGTRRLRTDEGEIQFEKLVDVAKEETVDDTLFPFVETLKEMLKVFPTVFAVGMTFDTPGIQIGCGKHAVILNFPGDISGFDIERGLAHAVAWLKPPGSFESGHNGHSLYRWVKRTEGLRLV